MDPWVVTWADYYEELTVSANASIRVIQAAYRVMAQDHHPDGGTQPDAERMTRINIAFEVLSDRSKKHRYDQIYRMHQPRPDGFASASPAPPPPTRWGWPTPDPQTFNDQPDTIAPESRHGSWRELLSYGVLVLGIVSVLVAVAVMLAVQ